MPAPRTPGRRVAERPPSRLAGPWGRSGARGRLDGRYVARVAAGAWLTVVVAALVLIGLHRAGVGPAWADQVAAVLVGTAFTVALAARTGGRPLVFGLVAAGIGVVALTTDHGLLRGGAAVLTAVSAAVLATMATVPAVRFRDSVRETLLAAAVAATGGLAAPGFRPTVSVDRFDYATLLLAFVLSVVLVYRLGAGLHGLGRRGLVVVVAGVLGLALTLLYAELLRRYGPPGAVDAVVDGVRWVREELGGVPRPIQVLVGFPALVWGTHMRARRRQGWWVCAFGVAATSSVAGLLMNPLTGLVEAGLILFYSLALGLGLGYLVIRLDLAFTAPRGRRGRRDEEASALRPEPSRLEPLL